MFNVSFRTLGLLLALLTAGIMGCESTPSQPTDPAPDGAVAAQRYDKTATLLSLAWVSYVNSGMMDTPENLQQHATEAMGKVLASPRVATEIATWTPVWGPVTYTQSTTCASDCRTDNTLALLKGQDPDDPGQDIYVVTIAGTNFTSLFDWGDEDFKATVMAEWPAAPTGKANNFGQFATPNLSGDPGTTNAGVYISEGLNTGIDILLNKMKSRGKTLPEFLKDEFAQRSSPVEVSVTGHSLGGGLSPCIALALQNNRGYWDPNSQATVTTYPFAGQTPGNKNFAEYFYSQIPEKNFHGHYNSLDVVPTGFEIDRMNQIEFLYENIDPHLADQCIIGKIIHCVKLNIETFNYTSLYDTQDQFTYAVTYNDSSYQAGLQEYGSSPWGTCAFMTTLDCIGFEKKWNCQEVFARTVNFGAMASIQHLRGYTDHFQIQTVLDVITANQQPSQKAPSFWGLYCDTPLFHGCPGTESLCKL